MFADLEAKQLKKKGTNIPVQSMFRLTIATKHIFIFEQTFPEAAVFYQVEDYSKVSSRFVFYPGI